MSKVIAVKNAQGEISLEVLGAPYGVDLDNEWFTDKTDFMLTGGKIPVLENHASGALQPDVLGSAVPIRKDKDGLWFRVVLDGAKRRAIELYEKARQGLLRASSGAISHLVRKAPSGEILTWALAELSLVDLSAGARPSNPRAVALAKMEAVYKSAGIETPTAWAEAQEELQEKADRLRDAPPEARDLIESLSRAVQEDDLTEWTSGDPFSIPPSKEGK